MAHTAACTNTYIKLLIAAAAVLRQQRTCSCSSWQCTVSLELCLCVPEAALPLHCSRAMLRRPCAQSSRSPQTSSQPSTLFSASQARAALRDGALSRSPMAATCMQQQVSHKPLLLGCWPEASPALLQVPGRALHGACACPKEMLARGMLMRQLKLLAHMKPLPVHKISCVLC